MKNVVIVDYGLGNLGSIKNMLRRLGISSEISGNKKVIEKSDKIILPGVGAFDTAIKNLEERDLKDLLIYKALVDRIPLLGICLGMQLLMDSSEEGNLRGLGLISGKVIRFNKSENLKVPHIGWNKVTLTKESVLTKDLPEDPRYYFVHSYFVDASERNQVILSCEYGIRFDAAINKENIYAVQFHPEKSHKYGLKLLENFINI